MVTTGGSVKEVMEIVREAGGEIVGVGSIVDRTNGKMDFGVPFKSVIAVDVQAWEPQIARFVKEGKS